MKIKNASLFLLSMVTVLLFSCSKKEKDTKHLKADISKLTKDFDKVCIYTLNNEVLGDSTQETKDTVKAKDGKFEYHFKTREPRHTSFFLLKNNKVVATLCFVDKYKEKNEWGSLYLGNENIEINTNVPADFPSSGNFLGSIKVYSVNYKGSEETDMFMKASIKKLVSSKIIKENPSCFVLLHELFWNKENFSVKQLQDLSLLFSDELKKSTSYGALQYYIKKREIFEKYGYRKNFNWVDINNKNYSFEQVRNDKPMLLLVFWASWCGPCRQEIPELKKFYAKYKDKVSMVSLSIDDNFDQWKNAVEKENMPWLNLSGLPKNKKGIKIEYNISVVPTLLLLDKNGKIITTNTNNLPEIIKIVDKN